MDREVEKARDTNFPAARADLAAYLQYVTYSYFALAREVYTCFWLT